MKKNCIRPFNHPPHTHTSFFCILIYCACISFHFPVQVSFVWSFVVVVFFNVKIATVIHKIYCYFHIWITKQTLYPLLSGIGQGIYSARSYKTHVSMTCCERKVCNCIKKLYFCTLSYTVIWGFTCEGFNFAVDYKFTPLVIKLKVFHIRFHDLLHCIGSLFTPEKVIYSKFGQNLQTRKFPNECITGVLSRNVSELLNYSRFISRDSQYSTVTL